MSYMIVLVFVERVPGKGQAEGLNMALSFRGVLTIDD
jgi:hypothetical protein